MYTIFLASTLLLTLDLVATWKLAYIFSDLVSVSAITCTLLTLLQLIAYYVISLIFHDNYQGFHVFSYLVFRHFRIF